MKIAPIAKVSILYYLRIPLRITRKSKMKARLQK